MLTSKSVIIIHEKDKSMCSMLRRHAVAQLGASGRTGDFEFVISPEVVRDEYILKYTCAVIIGRPIGQGGASFIEHYGRLKKKYNFRIVTDYDDIMWDINGKSMFPEYNRVKKDAVGCAQGIEQSLKYVDEVTFSTEYLANCWAARFGDATTMSLVPNYLPKMWYGQRKHRIKEKLVKPKVVYGGSYTHYTPEDPGDFAGVWVPWMLDAVANDRIELHMFGYECKQEFLQTIADKIILHDPVTSCEWGSTLRDIEGDIYMAPLARNPFNCAKSDLKLSEACATGMAFLGSFWDGYCPYANAHPMSRVLNDCSVEQLNKLVDAICEPDTFNDIMSYQEEHISNRWIDDAESRNLSYVLHTWCRGYINGGA